MDEEIEPKDIPLNASHEHLWSLSDPSVVGKYFLPDRKSGGDGSELFFRHVAECIEKRIGREKAQLINDIDGGRLLQFAPHFSMFEDVAIDLTFGFYGVGDCPPPEFWAHVEGDVLISFIPTKYIDVANIGVEICVAGNLQWVSG